MHSFPIKRSSAIALKAVKSRENIAKLQTLHVPSGLALSQPPQNDHYEQIVMNYFKAVVAHSCQASFLWKTGNPAGQASNRLFQAKYITVR